MDTSKARPAAAFDSKMWNGTREEEQAYEELADHILEHRDGLNFEWSLPWPKWHFIEWLTRRGDFIFHGSPLPGIRDIRTEAELGRDHGPGRDRQSSRRLRDTFRTLGDVVRRHRSSQTQRLDSKRRHVLARPLRQPRPVSTGSRFTMTIVGGDIWRTGTLYLFPKDDFEPIPFYPGGPASNEWASTSEVRPLARLTVDPGDFPFLDQVGGHDDGELIAAEVIGDIVMSKVTGARSVPGGMVVSLAWDDELAGVWDEYMTTGSGFTSRCRAHPVDRMRTERPP